MTETPLRSRAINGAGVLELLTVLADGRCLALRGVRSVQAQVIGSACSHSRVVDSPPAVTAHLVQAPGGSSFGLEWCGPSPAPAIDDYDVGSALLVALAREDAARTTTVENVAWLFDELRYGHTRSEDEIVAAGRMFGFELSEPFAAVIARVVLQDSTDDAVETVWAAALDQSGTVVLRDGLAALAVLPADDIHRVARELQDRLETALSPHRVVIAVGSVADFIGSSRRTFEDAEFVDALNRIQGRERVRRFDDLGLATLLARLEPWALRAYVDRWLAPLRPYPELVETVRMWLASGESRSDTAAALYVHVNSVSYRLGRIRELVGVPALDSRVVRELACALEAKTVLSALELLRSREKRAG